MSKGNRIVPVRFSEDAYADMVKQIEDSNDRRSEEPWTVSEFIRIAIAEKLAKMERSRTSHKSKRKSKDTSSSDTEVKVSLPTASRACADSQALPPSQGE